MKIWNFKSLGSLDFTRFFGVFYFEFFEGENRKTIKKTIRHMFDKRKEHLGWCHICKKVVRILE